MLGKIANAQVFALAALAALHGQLAAQGFKQGGFTRTVWP